MPWPPGGTCLKGVHRSSTVSVIPVYPPEARSLLSSVTETRVQRGIDTSTLIVTHPGEENTSCCMNAPCFAGA